MTGSKNLDIRSFAAAHSVKLYEIAEKLGMSPSMFSTAYMRTEQSRTTKDKLRVLIREIERERRAEDEKKIQA